MSRPKILLVDDARLFIKLEQEFLKQSAVSIMTADNGRQALDAVKVVRPDLIFMDLHMPEMDGAQCCATLKADPDLRTIPVIIVSVADRESELERCREAGCDAVLSKPIDRQAFLQVGNRFLPQIAWCEARTPCRTLVVYRINNQSCYGTSEDLSTQGIFIASAGDFLVDDRVRLSFQLPAGGSPLIEATGRVAWINSGPLREKPDLPHGFGVEFLEIDREAVQAIQRFMEEAPLDSTLSQRIERAYHVREYF